MLDTQELVDFLGYIWGSLPLKKSFTEVVDWLYMGLPLK